MSKAEDVVEGGERVSKGRQRSPGPSDGKDHRSPPHPGASLVGTFIFLLIIYGVYQQMWDFVLYNTTLLVVLALGSKGLN